MDSQGVLVLTDWFDGSGAKLSIDHLRKLVMRHNKSTLLDYDENGLLPAMLPPTHYHGYQVYIPCVLNAPTSMNTI